MSKFCPNEFVYQSEEDISGDDYFSEKFLEKIREKKPKDKKKKIKHEYLSIKDIMRDYFGLDKSQIKKISKLKYADGSKFISLYDDTEKTVFFLIEVINKMTLKNLELNYENLLNFLNNQQINTIEDIIKVDPTEKINELQNNIDKEIEINTMMESFNPDFGACPACREKTLTPLKAKQSRSADEATDEWFRCLSIGCPKKRMPIHATAVITN